MWDYNYLVFNSIRDIRRINIAWVCRKHRQASSKATEKTNSCLTVPQNCLDNVGASIFNLLAVYLTGIFVKQGIWRTCVPCLGRVRQSTSPAFQFAHLDSILSAERIRHFLCPVATCYIRIHLLTEILQCLSFLFQVEWGAARSWHVSMSKRP